MKIQILIIIFSKVQKTKDIDSLFVHIIVLVCPWCIKFSIIYTSRLQCTKNEFC